MLADNKYRIKFRMTWMAALGDGDRTGIAENHHSQTITYGRHMYGLHDDTVCIIVFLKTLIIR